MSARQRYNYPPYVTYLIAVFYSVALLAMQTTLPFKLKELGGGFDAVGFLFTWTSSWYIAAGLLLGRLSHRFGPRRTMLVTLGVCALAAFAMAGTTTTWQLYALTVFYLVASCLFWSAMEHASTGLHGHLTIVQSTAIFCVAFSSGNALGTILSTQLQRQNVAVPFLASGGLTLLVAVLTWFAVSPEAGFHRASSADIAAFPESSRHRLRRSLLASRTGLVGTYGTYALLTLFLPRYLWEVLGHSKPVAGLVTSLLLVAMAATFALHGLRTGWPHRLGLIRACPFAAALALLVLSHSTQLVVICLAVAAIGVLAGTVYSHNLYYSLEEPGQRAVRAGLHEAVVGIAFVAPPAFGGLATRLTQDPRTIFWAGAALAVGMGLAQNVALAVYRRAAPAS